MVCYNRKINLLQYLWFLATIAYIFCYQFSGEVSGDISDEVSGDVSDDISGDVSNFATIHEFFCYNSTTFLLHRLRRVSDEICVYFG
jgi:hypothetical protein